MKTKQELEKTIKDTIIMYKEIIFGVDSPTYKKHAWMKFGSSK